MAEIADIKLVITDVDGTLMTDDGLIPPQIFEVIEALICRGVTFAVASGRQLQNLQQLFEPLASNIFFVANNGATLAEGYKVLTDSLMHPAAVDLCLDFAQLHAASPLLYANGTVLTNDASSALRQFLEKHQVPFAVSQNLAAYACGVSKLSLLKFDGSMPQLKPLLATSGIEVFVANRYMLDVTAEGTNKGVTISRLINLIGVAEANVCAFGDSENDLDMFANAGLRFEVANAAEVLKKKSRIVPSNNDLGVICTLRQLFNIA